MQSIKLELLDLTKLFLNRADLIQGPGGNTSVKSEDGSMFIKASGFRFDEMSLTNGISAVNSMNIAKYFFSVEPVNKVEEEKTMLGVIANNILADADGNAFPKPSMETGFHAILEKYVIHTHSVWSNLINCAQEKASLLETLRQKTGINIEILPFVSPGFGLSYLIAQILKQNLANGLKRPDVFFLSNHGIISHAQSKEVCQEQLFKIDQAIKDLLHIKQEYPSIELKEEALHFAPQSSFVNGVLSKYQCQSDFFNQVLFPDQTVFFKDQIAYNTIEKSRKIHISNQWQIRYNCSFREARSIHETMTAYLFIYDFMHSNNIPIELIGDSEIDYINNMEMEKYRKKIQN
jgi:rhamnose utilization protein RhaD (predicted bifunctional aldolase and dehydrogenase)